MTLTAHIEEIIEGLDPASRTALLDAPGDGEVGKPLTRNPTRVAYLRRAGVIATLQALDILGPREGLTVLGSAVTLKLKAARDRELGF